MDEILTAEQVANILQVHPFTVLKFIKQGKLKASKLGRVYRIRRSDVDEFLDNQVQKAEVPKPKAKESPSKEKGRKSKETNKSRKTSARNTRNTRKDQKTPRSETKALKESSSENKVGPPIEVPTKEVIEKKEPIERPDQNDSDHYKLKI